MAEGISLICVRSLIIGATLTCIGGGVRWADGQSRTDRTARFRIKNLL